MGDRVAVLKDGYLQQVDTPQNLYDEPTNVFVAAFIGSPSMNLYEGQLTLNGDSSVQIGSQRVALAPELLSKRPALQQYSGQRVVVGIRPEDFEDAAIATSAPADRRLKAKVRLVEALGSELVVHFEIDDAKRVNSGDPDAPEELLGEGVANAVARFSPKSRVNVDEDVEVSVASENMHFFDAQTHQTIWS
jgi:multiple sugar transport system ATP-binding protein